MAFDSGNFLPQLGITDQILGAIHLASQHSEQLAAQQTQQKNSDTARMEAQTAAQRLQTEIPYIKAQTEGQLTANQKSAQQLAQNEFATSYLNGESGHGSEAHIAGVVGPHGHYGVPAEAPAPVTVSNPNPAPTPDTLNVAQPLGQNLAEPSAPISTDTGASVQANNTTPIAQPASGEQGPTGPFAQANRRVECLRIFPKFRGDWEG